MVARQSTKESVRARLEAALAARPSFKNFHGITNENVRSFVVDPYEVLVDPDDGESPARSMWAVLSERPVQNDGYVVVFDPQDESWGVIEKTSTGTWIMVVAADDLGGALDRM